MNLDISGYTDLLCLLGHPAKHSLSPKMHNTAFEKLGLDYVYLAFDILPEEIAPAVAALKMFNAKGFNLTMPFKETVIPYLDELSEAASLCGSVNTVVNEGGRLIGHTTDGAGYMQSLKDAGFAGAGADPADGTDAFGGTMTVLGAGGAARSIVAEAALSGAEEIFIFQRKSATFEKAVEFAGRVSDRTSCRVSVLDIADEAELKRCLDASSLLCNATNVGMGEDDRSLVPKEYLLQDLFVSDIIYHPEMTRLLKDAKAAGAPYANGKYMLLFQGAAAFKLWTGKDMPTDEIKKAGIF